MTVGRVENRISITGRETASKAANKAGRGLDKLGKKVETTAQRTSRLNKENREAQKSFKAIGTTALVAAAAVAAAAKASYDFAVSGEQALNVTMMAKKSLVDYTTEMDAARSATAGLVQDTPLEAYMTKLRLLGVESEVVNKSLETSVKAALSLGMETDQVMRLLVDVSKGRTTRIAELGTMIPAAALKGKTALEKFNIVVEATSKTFENVKTEEFATATKKLARDVGNAWSDMQSAAAKMREEMAARGGLYADFGDNFALLFDEMVGGDDILDGAVLRLKRISAEMKVASVHAEALAENTRLHAEARAVENLELEGVIEELARAKRLTNGISDAQYAAAGAAKAQAEAQAEVNKLYDSGKKTAEVYTVALRELASAARDAAAAAAIVAYEETLSKGYEGSLDKWFEKKKKKAGGGGGGGAKEKEETFAEWLEGLSDAEKWIDKGDQVTGPGGGMDLGDLGIASSLDLGTEEARVLAEVMRDANEEFGTMRDLSRDIAAARFDELSTTVSGIADGFRDGASAAGAMMQSFAGDKAAKMMESTRANAAAMVESGKMTQDAADDMIDASERQANALEKNAKRINDVLGAMTNAFAGFGAATSDFGREQAAIKGIGALAAALIDDTMILSLIKVAEETAMGISALAGVYTAALAPGHFAAAAAWAVSAALAGAKGKGKGGGSSASSSSGAGVGATRAPRSPTGGNETSGAIIYNFHGYGVIGTAQEITARGQSRVAALRGTGMDRPHSGV